VTVRTGTFTALEIMVRAELKLSGDVGVKLSVRVQDCPGRSVEPFVQVPPDSEKGGLKVEIPARVRAKFPLFFIIKLLSEELPTLTKPKSMGFGATLMSAALALPVTVTSRFGFTGSFEGIVILPEKAPGDAGAKSTEILHVVPPLIVRPEQVSAVILNGGAGEVTEPISKSPAPLFVTVRESVKEEPTTRVPKLRLDCARLIKGAAVPT
jgi:hypothetical protein